MKRSPKLKPTKWDALVVLAVLLLTLGLAARPYFAAKSAGELTISIAIDGETVDEVLGYVQYNPKKLVRQLEQWVTKSVNQQKITMEEGKEFLSNYRSGLYGYTYLEQS